MLERIEGIVIDIVKHNDAHNVVTLYTRRHGRLAFLVPVGKSKGGRMRNSLLSLLAIVGADVNIRPGKELYTLRSVEPLRLWHGIYADPVKGALVFFLAEFCSRLVRQYPADTRLWDYIVSALEVLERAEGAAVANFHLAFLVRMLAVVGIEPSGEKEFGEGHRFDMATAEMLDTADPTLTLRVAEATRRHTLLDFEESRAAQLLLRMNFANSGRFRFSRGERRRAVDRLLSYYTLHLPLGSDFKSLPVLHDLFS